MNKGELIELGKSDTAVCAHRNVISRNCSLQSSSPGTLETPEFQSQNREFAAAVKKTGKPIKFLVGEGYNHFEMFETLGNPYGLLGRAMLEQMNLRTV